MTVNLAWELLLILPQTLPKQHWLTSLPLTASPFQVQKSCNQYWCEWGSTLLPHIPQQSARVNYSHKVHSHLVQCVILCSSFTVSSYNSIPFITMYFWQVSTPPPLVLPSLCPLAVWFWKSHLPLSGPLGIIFNRCIFGAIGHFEKKILKCI